MYQPGRPRPRLTSITRTRSGCMTCRRRKKRCDEALPRCSACARLSLDCVPATQSIRFSSQRCLIGPSPPVSQASWKDERNYDSGSPTSTRHANLASASRNVSPPTPKVTSHLDSSHAIEQSSPLLTPESSNEQSQLDSDLSSFGNSELYPTSPSLTPREANACNEWDLLDCSFLLEIDWTSPPWPFHEIAGIGETAQLTHDQVVSDYQSRPPRQAWFTALSGEQEASSNPTSSAFAPGQAESTLTYELKKLYNNHWDNTVLDILPPVFRELSSYAINCEALESGILALSAAHLGHIQVQVRVKFGTDDEYYTGPNHGHLIYMRQFYDAALRQLSKFIAEVPADNVLTLGSFLILMLVEKTVGSFRGEAFHESGIDKMISQELSSLSKDPLGYGLIRAWLVFRAMNWSHRIPFTVLSYGRALREVGIEFVSLLSRDAILPIMLESYHLNAMVLFERFVGRGDMEPISSRCYRFYHSLVEESSVTLPWRPAEHPPDDDYRGRLHQLSSPLDDWHSGLLLEDQPIESFGRHQGLGRSKFLSPSSHPRLFSLNPLHFRSHQAAMNYAYYLCACLLQSERLMSIWEHGHTQNIHNCGDESDYVLLLLRVLLGLDPKTCFEENIFSLGVSEIVLLVLLRCPPILSRNEDEGGSSSSLFMSFAKSVVKTFSDHSIFREGHASIERFRDIVHLNDRLRTEAGKSIFFLISGEADTAWTKIYGHGMDKAIVLGRDSHTQKMFGEKLVLHPTEKTPETNV